MKPSTDIRCSEFGCVWKVRQQFWVVQRGLGWKWRAMGNENTFAIQSERWKRWWKSKYSFLQFLEVTCPKDMVDETVGCICLLWSTDDLVDHSLRHDGTASERGLVKVWEWIQMKAYRTEKSAWMWLEKIIQFNHFRKTSAGWGEGSTWTDSVVICWTLSSCWSRRAEKPVIKKVTILSGDFTPPH